MWGEIDLTERKTEERKIDEENERERERNMESDMRKRGRDKNTEIERTKQEICRERKRCHERLL